MPGLLSSAQVQPGGVKQNGETAAEFEYYIDRASGGSATRMGTCVHQFGTKEAQPLLRKGKKNRILVYPGAFNPPHRGHMLVLQHGFRECGEDFNVVAAIVLMKKDQYLKYKNKCSDRSLLLDIKERTALWSTDEQFPDWAWIVATERWHSPKDASTDCERSSLKLDKTIIRLAKLDGFDVEFVVLIGPDNSERYESGFYSGDAYCDNMLVSTAARAPKGYSHISGPAKIKNFAVWVPVTPEKEKEEERAQLPSWLYSDEQATPSPPKQNETRIWACHSLEERDVSLRYLYTPHAVSDGEATELVSATAIHAAITTTTKQESTLYIDQFALSATYLKRQLARREDGTHAQQLNKEEMAKLVKHVAFEEITSGALDGNECKYHGITHCGCWYACDRAARKAQKKAKKLLEAAGPAFEDLMRESRVVGAEKNTKISPKLSEVIDIESDQDLSFEDTMRLRVPSKADEPYNPEYQNANKW